MSTPAVGPPKLVRGRKAKAFLAAACLLVLIVGALIAPPRVPSTAAPVEAAAPILEQQLERRSSARAFRGVQDAGQAALRFSVTFAAPKPPAARTYADFAGRSAEAALPSGFGVLVSDREVLTHVAAIGGRTQVEAHMATGAVLAARAKAYEPDTGLVLLELALPVAVPPPPPAEAAPGELAVAAARVDGREFVAPVFIAATDPERYLISAASGVILPGTPVYALTGEPLAVVPARADLPLAYPVASAVGRLRRLMAEGRALPSSIGVTLQALQGRLAEKLGPGAAVLSDIVPGGPADQAGLQPGDVLLRIGAANPQGLDDALNALARMPASAAATLAVRREGKVLEVTVSPVVALRRPGQVVTRPHPGDAPAAATLFASEALRAAGVEGDARVLTLERRRLGAREAEAFLARRTGPVLAHLQEGPHRFFAVLGGP